MVFGRLTLTVYLLGDGVLTCMLMLGLLLTFSADGVKSIRFDGSLANGDTGADRGVVGPANPATRLGVSEPRSGVDI